MNELEIHEQAIQQLQEECDHQRLTSDGSSCIECGKDIEEETTEEDDATR